MLHRLKNVAALMLKGMMRTVPSQKTEGMPVACVEPKKPPQVSFSLKSCGQRCGGMKNRALVGWSC